MKTLNFHSLHFRQQQHIPRRPVQHAMYVRAPRDPDSFEEPTRRREPRDYKDIAARQLVVASKPPAGTAAPPPGMQCENLYLRRMDSRPLPSLPNIAESVQSNSDDDPDKAKIQVYRTNSGREHYHRPYVVTWTGSKGPPSRDPRVNDPQYFVLDAQEEAAKAAAIESAAAAAAAEQRRRARQANMAADKTHGVRQKTPEEENAENFNKEVNLNNSCHEIPLRPTREGSQQSHSDSNNSGNSSWP